MYLIDANNLLHKLRAASRDFPRDFGHGLQAMVNLLNTFGEQQKEHVLACFDGGPGDVGEGSYTRPFVRVHFGYGREADHLILEHIHASNDASQLTVVSSDNQVRGFAKGHRARSITSEVFAKKLVDQSHSPRKSKKRSRLDAFVQEHGYLHVDPATIAKHAKDDPAIGDEKRAQALGGNDGHDPIGEMMGELKNLDWDALVDDALKGEPLPKLPKGAGATGKSPAKKSLPRKGHRR